MLPIEIFFKKIYVIPLPAILRDMRIELRTYNAEVNILKRRERQHLQDVTRGLENSLLICGTWLHYFLTSAGRIALAQIP